jgi:hypothetical protein
MCLWVSYKKKIYINIFFYILKITEENSRIRSLTVSISQKYGSGDPDSQQNVTDPQHCKLTQPATSPPQSLSPFFTVYRGSDRKLGHFPRRRRRSVRRADSVRPSLRQLWPAKHDVLITARKLSAATAVKNIKRIADVAASSFPVYAISLANIGWRLAHRRLGAVRRYKAANAQIGVAGLDFGTSSCGHFRSEERKRKKVFNLRIP